MPLRLDFFGSNLDAIRRFDAETQLSSDQIDEIAQAMIARAHACGIPVIRHVWLARTLYATCQDDMPVPRSSYQAVAQVYAVVHELVASGEVQREVELESLGEPPERDTLPKG